MTLVQKPNAPLIIAILATLVQYSVTGATQYMAMSVYYCAISAWAYLEIAQGINWFRKTLGAIVMAWTLYSLFLQLQ